MVVYHNGKLTQVPHKKQIANNSINQVINMEYKFI